MSIGTFLADENYGSWADEMEDMPLPLSAEPRAGFGGERRAFSGAPTSFGHEHGDRERGYAREELPLPTQPPYTAHIGNLSFDATQADISDLFAPCEVTNVRIVEDKLTRAPKGFGYVEFATLDGLKKALSYQGTSLQGRNIRVSVAEPPKERHEARDLSDWSRKGPLPDIPQRRVSDRPGYAPRGFDAMSDAGSERAGRRPYEPAADGKIRDFSTWERKGPLPAAPVAREGGRPRSKDGPQFRRGSPAWGEGRSQDGSRPPRREFQERPLPERAPTAPELDNQWRARMRPDPPAQPPAPVPAPAPAPVAPAAPAPSERPKLHLQKRTVPDTNASIPSAGDAKSSPFGGARPIDTATREREIEEKRLQKKKEAEEKAKAEKEEQQRLAKEEESAQEKAKEEAPATAAVGANGSKESGSDLPQGGKSFEVLQHLGETENGGVVAAPQEAPVAQEASVAPAAPIDEKPKSPKEAGRPQPPSRANNSWRPAGPRRGSAHGQPGPRNRAPPKTAPQQPSAPAVDEEGWSTVSSKPRGSRRGSYRNVA
ncbi:Eukaryotic translation initiation factor 4B [Emydomyces testavorans]|uniref:Eukaryotic translation initiation factor 4B n=1 Tax=Emydomyces testavorans TaxID=2070801 RepID=A0AAF0IL24_9EURO|nr:Eukaryotic translation initiation factor 4B [Emydomyces testavorans]